MTPAGVIEEHMKLKAFTFSLQDAGKDWLYYLPAESVTNWEGLKRVFLEKFFSASRVTSIRKEICGNMQQDRERVYEYWERFKRLCTSFPYHQINEQLLIQYFYEGLMAIDRQMIDAASGGVLVDKTSRKMEEADKEILKTFRKVEVNIPVLDVIKQIPRYAKFLKDLCTHKRRLKGNKKVNMGRNVSALIEKSVAAIPEKCKDPDTFTIPCIIGNNRFENAMLDLGASINVMPLSVFTSLSLGPLKPTGVVIQLVNRSTIQPA